MDDNGGRKGFQAGQRKCEKTDAGGGIILSVQGARFEDHSDTARKLEERMTSVWEEK